MEDLAINLPLYTKPGSEVIFTFSTNDIIEKEGFLIHLETFC